MTSKPLFPAQIFLLSTSSEFGVHIDLKWIQSGSLHIFSSSTLPFYSSYAS